MAAFDHWKPVRWLRAQLGARHNVRAHFWQSLSNYAQHGFAIVFGVILARLLAPEDFGKFIFAQAFLFLALIPTTWGFGTLLVVDGGKTPGLYGQILAVTYRFMALDAIVVCAVAAWFGLHRDAQAAVLALIVGTGVVASRITAVQRADLEGRGLFKANFFANALGPPVTLAVVVPLCLAGWGPYALALAAILPLVVVFPVYRKMGGRTLRPAPGGWEYVRAHWKSGFWLWLGGMAETVQQRGDKLLVEHWFGGSILAFYNRAFSYAPTSGLILNSLTTNATVNGIRRAEGGAARRRLLVKTTAILLAGAGCDYLAWHTFADALVPFIFGSQWAPAIPFFKAFATLSVAGALLYIPVAIAVAFSRFRLIALARLALQGAFLGGFLLMGKPPEPTHIAIGFQGALIVAGAIILMGVAGRLRGRG